MSLKEILEFDLIDIGKYSLTVYKLAMLVVIFLVVRILLWFIKKAIARQWKFKKLDSGSEYAVFQIIKYFLYIIAIVLALETMGVKVTLLIAGSAALLVGVGLGLQQTFNDVISGIILLLEGSTKVGDVLEVDDDIVKVRQIGLRASKVIDRNDIIIIIPNSLIVTNKVINWSHQLKETRFIINVGVAYGSDVDLVMELLVKSAMEHSLSSKKRKPEARFSDFGDSALQFQLLFWSGEMFRIEKVLSDIRRTIDQKFREHHVTIPFPQRDLHLRSSNVELR